MTSEVSLENWSKLIKSVLGSEGWGRSKNLWKLLLKKMNSITFMQHSINKTKQNKKPVTSQELPDAEDWIQTARTHEEYVFGAAS